MWKNDPGRGNSKNKGRSVPGTSRNSTGSWSGVSQGRSGRKTDEMMGAQVTSGLLDLNKDLELSFLVVGV